MNLNETIIKKGSFLPIVFILFIKVSNLGSSILFSNKFNKYWQALQADYVICFILMINKISFFYKILVRCPVCVSDGVTTGSPSSKYEHRHYIWRKPFT